ncbi:MAG: hypothetical protein JJU35_10365 [Balneolales bacterium]|nr:hypothetical protein [Balneolales bacterium]
MNTHTDKQPYVKPAIQQTNFDLSTMVVMMSPLIGPPVPPGPPTIE